MAGSGHGQEAYAYVVAPSGAAGGGMGRVKDYLVSAPQSTSAEYRLRPLVTRDDRGLAVSALLLARALLKIVAGRVSGRLRFVHVNLGDNGSAVRKGMLVLATRALGVPVFLHLHAVELERQWRERPGIRHYVRWPFRAADRVIVLGERWRRWLVDEVGVASDRVHIVWNGVPQDGTAPQAIAARGPELVFLGNLLERKGVGDLLAALARLGGGPADWRATFVGGGDLDRYVAQADALGLSGRVRFLGWLPSDEAQALLRAAGMLVLPSYEEGLPLVILEALGAGTPVVCTPVGSIGEVLTDGETALFCRPGDPVALAAAIERLADNPALRAHLAANGLALFARRFSLDAFRASLRSVWREGLARVPAAPLAQPLS